MMERHCCAHPSIPGYGPPDTEVWAYLWENWYRHGRWELWARCGHKLIPILKTTMINSLSWRRIKHDFLHCFHMPRCDLLVWILVTKLAPTYYRKLDQLLKETGRYRELSSWRKEFKKIWRKLSIIRGQPLSGLQAPRPGYAPCPPYILPGSRSKSRGTILEAPKFEAIGGNRSTDHGHQRSCSGR